MSYGPTKTVNVPRRLFATAKMDRQINRAIRRESRRGYVYVGQQAIGGQIRLMFVVPSKATKEVMSHR